MTPGTLKFSCICVIACFLFTLAPKPSTATPQPSSIINPLSFHGTLLYVGGTGSGNYSKIQDAIDNASSGDTIFVYCGLYKENILIKTSINLVGENASTVVIDGSGYGSVITIAADNTLLQKCTIQNAKNDVNFAGVDIFSAKNVVVSETIIQNNGGIGLSTRGSGTSKITIEMSRIRNNSYGVCVQNSPTAVLVANNISDNGVGLYLIGSFGSHILNNTIVNRGLGLHLEDTFGVYVAGNWIVNNANGVYVVNSTDILFKENTIGWNRWYGLWFKDTSLSDIDRNSISDNIDVGLFLESSYDIRVTNNTIWNNDNGIYLKDASGNSIQHNNLRNFKMNACFVAHTLLHRRNIWWFNYWERARVIPYPIFGVIKLEKYSLSWLNVDWMPLRHPPQSLLGKAASCYQAILYVGGNGPNNYSSIQEAINDAQSNDTVYVFNGTYYEKILIQKPLLLIGENKTTTILEGNGTRDIITIVADYVTIRDFTIQNGHFNILVNHSSYGNITGNNIDGGLHGVSVQNGCHFLRISHNSFEQNVYGIRLFSSTDMTVSYNALNSFKINAFYFGTSLVHGRHHWFKNYWGETRFLPYIIVGKIRIGNFSLTWMNFDWSPSQNPFEERNRYL
ncbi:MAG: right-handed parallel beta-helix repeat-containing protein [Candidatus Thermoplasmatota archaeon]|nr:right-handed parallel beta-helix repeat-containing protein [Candidatus Thermoplasmatota archaeon]